MIIYYSLMARTHRHQILPADDLRPSDPLSGVLEDAQAAEMRELRELQNRIADGYRQRDQRMAALALSNSLSRRDMARATGLVESRVNQIIREVVKMDQLRRNEAAAEQIARHTPR